MCSDFTAWNVISVNLQYFQNTAAFIPQTPQMYHQINSGCNLPADGGNRNFTHAAQDHHFEAAEHISRAVAMSGGKSAVMAGVQCLKQIHRLRAPNFPYDDAIRPHSKTRADQIPDGYLIFTLLVRPACLQPDQIFYMVKLQLCIVFNRNHAFIFRDIGRKCIQKRGFSAPGSPADKDVVARLHHHFQELCRLRCQTVPLNQLLHQDRMIREAADSDNRPVNGHRRHNHINPRTIFQSRIDNRI